jgi:hypothetical protein
MVAIGKVVFTSREHVIALEARGKGMMGITLRYPYEVRDEKDYFDEIPDEKVPKDMLELAAHIVDTKKAHFDPKKFEDQCEDALKELLTKAMACLARGAGPISWRSVQCLPSHVQVVPKIALGSTSLSPPNSAMLSPLNASAAPWHGVAPKWAGISRQFFRTGRGA